MGDGKRDVTSPISRTANPAKSPRIIPLVLTRLHPGWFAKGCGASRRVSCWDQAVVESKDGTLLTDRRSGETHERERC